MNDLTKEEVIAMLWGMILINQMSETEKMILEQAIQYLESDGEGEKDER